MAKGRSRSSGPVPGLIGVIHLPALAGAPGAFGVAAHRTTELAGARAVAEAKALEKAGFEAIIVENFGDAPFYKDRVPAETIASMALLAAAVRGSVRVPVGVNVLRNDGAAALAIAAVAGCDFIRVNVLTGVSATDQGLIEGQGAWIARERQRLHADLGVLADVHVKHARSLNSEDVALAVEETAGRGLADAVIVTGATTGRLASVETLRAAHAAARACGKPLLLGSGTDPRNLAEAMRFADGVIVGSALRKGGRPGAPLETERLKRFVTAYRQSRRKGSGKR